MAVFCDLASLCAVQVPMTAAISGVFSGRGRDVWMTFPKVHYSLICSDWGTTQPGEIQVQGVVAAFLRDACLEWCYYTGFSQFILLKASIQKENRCADWYHRGMFSNSHANCRGGGGFPSAMLCGYLTANCLNEAYFGNHKVKTSDSE